MVSFSLLRSLSSFFPSLAPSVTTSHLLLPLLLRSRSFASDIRFNDATAPPAHSLTITDKCVEKIKSMSAKQQKAPVLRVRVDSGGCSGFQYVYELDATQEEDDVVFEKEGAKVCVDETSMSFIEGAKIDYCEELIKSSFEVIENPNAVKSCGCGSSFALKGLL